MTAADAREELEAAAWRALRLGGWVQAVDAILDAADAYATAVASDALDGVVRAARQRDRRDAVADALADLRGRS